MKKLKFKELKEDAKLLRLDLGAGLGRATPEGFIPVDLHRAKGIKQVDLRNRWPWKANSVDDVVCHYLLQVLTANERVHFMNELYRVMKPDTKALIVVPFWCAARAYGDIRVQWPPVSEAWYQTLSKSWREAQNNVDTAGYTCDFDATIGYGMHQLLLNRSDAYKQDALMFFKEAAQDLLATLTKRGVSK